MGKRGKNLLERGTRCLFIQSKFDTFSFWNYFDACKILGAKFPTAPLGLMTAAALLPRHWEFRLVDENVEPLLDQHFEWADMVCTGGMAPQRPGIISIIEKAHQMGRPVVVGGRDPTAQPHWYKSADYLVTGEGEVTIPMFIQGLEKGDRGGEYHSPKKADMGQAVVPRYDLIGLKNYMQIGVQYSRGCPYNCEFCDFIEINGRKPRTKNPGQVIKELQFLYDLGYRGYVDFVDDNFIGNKKNVKETLLAVKDWYEANNNPFYFSTETSIDLAEDAELLHLMKDVDFRYIFIGIETTEDRIIKSIQKKQNINKDIISAVKRIQSYGMTILGSFIIGFDGETAQTAGNIIQCIRDSGLCMVMLWRLNAAPHTQLTRRLQREGRLLEAAVCGSNYKTEEDSPDSPGFFGEYRGCNGGLNFITARPRLEILNDYIHILENIYNPVHYYQRLIRTCLDLKPANKYKPGPSGNVKLLMSFLRVCRKLGFNKASGWLFWKMFFKVLFKNPPAIEMAVSLSVMCFHLYHQSKHIIAATSQEIRYIEKYGEESYIQLMRREDNL